MLDTQRTKKWFRATIRTQAQTYFYDHILSDVELLDLSRRQIDIFEAKLDDRLAVLLEDESNFPRMKSCWLTA